MTLLMWGPGVQKQNLPAGFAGDKQARCFAGQLIRLVLSFIDSYHLRVPARVLCRVIRDLLLRQDLFGLTEPRGSVKLWLNEM